MKLRVVHFEDRREGHKEGMGARSSGLLVNKDQTKEE
jgi:hypothetical protein